MQTFVIAKEQVGGLNGILNSATTYEYPLFWKRTTVLQTFVHHRELLKPHPNKIHTHNNNKKNRNNYFEGNSQHKLIKGRAKVKHRCVRKSSL